MCRATAMNGEGRDEPETIEVNGTKIEKFFSLEPDGKDFANAGKSPSTALFLLGVAEGKWGQTQLLGLVLKPTGSQRGQYVRVGFGETLHRDLNDANERRVYEIFSGTVPEPESEARDYNCIKGAFNLMSLPPEAFEEEDREAKVYTITIV